jgi:hypothetical protein
MRWRREIHGDEIRIEITGAAMHRMPEPGIGCPEDGWKDGRLLDLAFVLPRITLP